MHFKASTIVAVATLFAEASAHGLVTSIQGSNGVTMPGLGNIDGTPRDCSTPGCGAENDTPVFKNNAGALGKTKSGGEVSAAAGVSQFMGAAAAGGAAASGATGAAAKERRDFLSGLGAAFAAKAGAGNAAGAAAAAGGAAGGAAAKGNNPVVQALEQGLAQKIAQKAQQKSASAAATGAAAAATGAAADAVQQAAANNDKRGLLDQIKAQQAQQNNNGNDATPTKTPPGTVEDGVAAAAGKGQASGLPTVAANGTINLGFHQVNADGAGPYTAAVDPTSGGTSEAAFQPATMTVNVAGQNSLDGQNKASDMQLQVQMPAGMNCTGSVAGQQNVCVVRIQNSAAAGPFGGSAVFQQEGNQGANPAVAASAAGAAATPSAASAAVAASPATSAAAAGGAADAADDSADDDDAADEAADQAAGQQERRGVALRFARRMQV